MSKSRLFLILLFVVIVIGGGIVLFIYLNRGGGAGTLTFGPTTQTVTEPTAPTNTREPIVDEEIPAQTTVPDSTTGQPGVPTTPTTPDQGFTAPPLPTTDTVSRCSGSTPEQLTIECSKKLFPQSQTAETLFIYRDDNVVDAFSATPLIGFLEGSFLAVDTNVASQASLAEASRVISNKANQIYILGGTAAVSSAVEQQFRNAGFAKIKRLAGSTRNDTATKIAEEMVAAVKAKLGPTRLIRTAILTENRLFVDAFGAGPVGSGKAAGTTEAYVLLTERGSPTLDPATQAFIQQHQQQELVAVTIIGGTTAVDPNVEQTLRSMGLVVLRLAGSNRQETNALILNTYYKLAQQRTTWSNAFPGSLGGDNGLYSAQAGAAYASLVGAPMAMIAPDSVPDGQKAYVCKNYGSIIEAVVTGNLSDVTQAAQNEILGLIKGTKPPCP